MKTIKLSEIIVSKAFKRTMPKEEKLNVVREYVKKNGCLDKPVVLRGQMLVDGYVRYLVAQENGFEDVPYITDKEFKTLSQAEEKPNKYIVGVFYNCSKEYTWRVPNRVNVDVGDRVLVNSKYGKNGRAVVTVVKVYQSDDKELLKHKTIVKRLKSSDGKRSD